MTEAPTKPPAPPRRPAPNLSASRPRVVQEENVSADRPHTDRPKQTMGIHLPPLRAPLARAGDDTNEQTLVGIAPPSEPPARDSGLIAADGVFRQYETEHARADKLAAELAALRAQTQAIPAAASPVINLPPASKTPVSVPPSGGDMLKAGYKLMGALTLLLGVVSTYLGGRALSKEGQVDSVAAASTTQKRTTLTLEERVKALEKYSAALAKHSDCVDAERDSAIERGTGHVIEGDHADVQWAEQSLPVAKPRTIWKNPPWLIAKDEGCPTRPAPPRVAP